MFSIQRGHHSTNHLKMVPWEITLQDYFHTATPAPSRIIQAHSILISAYRRYNHDLQLFLLKEVKQGDCSHPEHRNDYPLRNAQRFGQSDLSEVFPGKNC